MNDPANIETSERPIFAELMRQYRAAHGHEADGAIPDTGDVRLNTSWGDVEFTMHHSMTRRPDLFSVACRFGPLPAVRADAAMWRLLSIQRDLTPAASANLGLDERTGEVFHTQALPVRGIEAAQLVEEMQLMYSRALEWRRSHFLDDAPDLAAHL